MEELPDLVLDWYAEAARDLPWRRPGTSPWAVLVSEVMLQQTPVARVRPAYEEWLARWPAPLSLAAEPAGEAVRQWGRLGYPRRALRLHESARAIVARHGGEVPATLDDLLALPGVGSYTARAVAAFAFGQRHPVVDTNVRRVLARVLRVVADAGPAAPARDLVATAPLLPAQPAVAARFSVALMELGALVCTGSAPRCGSCPIQQHCVWQQAGAPAYDGPRRHRQPFAGTDRQVRGRLLALLRATEHPLTTQALGAAWDEPVQRARALAGLVADGLVTANRDGTLGLPG